MYFNYHAQLKNLIKSGHSVGFEFVKEYHKISPCLLIYFDCASPKPVRKHKFDEYLFLLAKYNVKEIEVTEK